MRRVLTVIILLAFPMLAHALDIPDNIPSWRSADKEMLASMLETGELISVDYVGEKNIEMCSIAILADAPPERVWEVVTDFEGYSHLLPETMKTTELNRDGNTVDVHFEISVIRVSLVNITAEYTLRYKLSPPRRADIKWVEGDVKNVEGYWELYPVAGGEKTVAIYAITSDLASVNPIIGGALARQPATVMAINLSSAIVFVKEVIEKAQGRPLADAPAGSPPIWKGLDDTELLKLLEGGRAGFISRVGNTKIATAAALVDEKRDAVWDVLTDFGSYREHIPQITRSQVLDRDAGSARVRIKTEIIALGPIKIATHGVNVYEMQKPERLSANDEKNRRDDLFNIWELKSFGDGAKTGLFNSSVSDISELGTIANIMLDKLPAIQESIDLSQGLIMAHEIKKWCEE